MNLQTFNFPGEIPSKKNSNAPSRWGGRFKAKDVVMYERSIAAELYRQAYKPVTGEIALTIEIAYTSNRKDLDNMATTLIDAMQDGGLFENDRAIVDLHMKKRRCAKGEDAHAVVTIQTIG